MASSTQPRRVALRLACRHCSTTGRRRVRCDASTTAARPPAVAAAAPAQLSPGKPTVVPGRRRARARTMVTAQPTSTPSGKAMARIAAGSERPKTRMRPRPWPRSFARAMSPPRPSTTSVTSRNSNNQASTSSSAEINNVGTASDDQPDCTVAIVVGMSLVTIACSASSWGFALRAVMAPESRPTSPVCSRLTARTSSNTSVPCAELGACSNVDRTVNTASTWSGGGLLEIAGGKFDGKYVVARSSQ